MSIEKAANELPNYHSDYTVPRTEKISTEGRFNEFSTVIHESKDRRKTEHDYCQLLLWTEGVEEMISDKK
jgi:hypothetical protein